MAFLSPGKCYRFYVHFIPLMRRNVFKIIINPTFPNMYNIIMKTSQNIARDRHKGYVLQRTTFQSQQLYLTPTLNLPNNRFNTWGGQTMIRRRKRDFIYWVRVAFQCRDFCPAVNIKNPHFAISGTCEDFRVGKVRKVQNCARTDAREQPKLVLGKV